MREIKANNKKKTSYKDRARLLTEAEKQVIVDSYYNRNKKYMIRVMFIIVFVLVIVSIMWGSLWIFLLDDIGGAIKHGLICFVMTIIITAVLVWRSLVTFIEVVKQVQSDKMYAVDAVYDYTSGKYQHVFLKSYKKPYDGYDLVVREPLEKGDRVIVLQMRGKAWVYKARD